MRMIKKAVITVEPMLTAAAAALETFSRLNRNFQQPDLWCLATICAHHLSFSLLNAPLRPQFPLYPLRKCESRSLCLQVRSPKLRAARSLTFINCKAVVREHVPVCVRENCSPWSHQPFTEEDNIGRDNLVSSALPL